MADGDEGGGEGTVGPTSIALAETAAGAGSASPARSLPTLRPATAGAAGTALNPAAMALSRRRRLVAGTPQMRRGGR